MYRNRHSDFTEYFSETDGHAYARKECRFFIDSSTSVLKGVLLHNGNRKPSVPIAHGVHVKETYENIKFLLGKVNYADHTWNICADLKVVGILLGMQCKYTKYCCFLCEWDSRARRQHYIKKDWPQRNSYVPGIRGISNIPLVCYKNIYLPPLHLKLGLIKNFVKAWIRMVTALDTYKHYSFNLA